MSFNANTMYKAVDIDQLAKECKDAIAGNCYVVVGMFSEIGGVFRSYKDARGDVKRRNKSCDDNYWVVEEHRLN